MNRRDMLKIGGGLTAMAVAANFSVIAGKAYAQEGDKPIRLGLIGCGGRGVGAVHDSLNANRNAVVVAIADLDANQVKAAATGLAKSYGNRAVISESNQFVGIDSYKKLCALPEVDVVLQATPPGLRYLTLREAVINGKHSFVEKPVCVDAFTYQHVLESGRMAAEKKLAIVSGTQYRRENSYKDIVNQLQNGVIGDIVGAQAYYQASIPWLARGSTQGMKPETAGYQLRNWLHYGWLAGDCIAEQDIHNIDAIDWILKSSPVKAYANGGFGIRGIGDAYDSFSVDYTYANDVHVAFYGRQINGVKNKVFNKIIGTKGTCIIFPSPGSSRALAFEHGKQTPIWQNTGKENNNNPYEQEHFDLVQGIVQGKIINEIKAVADTSISCVIGRESAYTGNEVEFNKYVASGHRIGCDLPASEDATLELPVNGIRVPGKYKVKM